MSKAVPNGTIRPRMNVTTGLHELYIRKGPRHWQRLMIHNWELVHGDIPVNYVLRSTEGCSDIYDPANMYLVSKSQIAADTLAAKRERTGHTRNKRAPKPAKKAFKARVLDLSQKTRLFIPELRMHVYVDPDKTVAQVREKYLSHHQFMGKTAAI